ncbi:hypothetical protein [Sulfurovum sp.]|uniref:hypothetical protein n=1 Tax=Sulfurovum sp. TaxID=1969726 RepID=UPI003563C1FA
MKKILLLLIILPVLAFSAIDERKTDVYFANGILTKEKDARSNANDILFLVPNVLVGNAYQS